MKKINFKGLVISCLACLAPILLGLAFYGALPERMAIHFDVNNSPDGFASREFAVFGLPVLMALLQAFCCTVSDINAAKKGGNRKFELAVKSIIPVITLIVYTATVVYALGAQVDIRRVAMFVVGAVFIAIGNYLPKLNYVNMSGLTKEITPERAKRINRFIGYETVVLGVVFIITIFLPTPFSVGALVLIVPYILAAIIAVLRSKR